MKAMWVYLRLGPHGHERGSRQPRRARRARLSVVSRVRDLARVAFAAGETMSGWRQNWQAEGLGFGDHALVVGDEHAELTRDACGRGEMDRVERPQRRPTDLRGSRRYRLDRKQPHTSKYADGDRGSVTAEAPCGSGDLDRGEQA